MKDNRNIEKKTIGIHTKPLLGAGKWLQKIDSDLT